MNRRDLLRLLSVAGASVTALPGEPAPIDWARLADAADRAAPFDQAMIDQYAQVNANLWTAYAGAGSKATALPAAHGQVQILIDALRRPGMPTQRQRLCGLLGETLQLTGEIHFDGNRYTEAAHCYTLAATASREAEAYDLWACALTRQAIIANFERQHTAASALLEAAAGLARRGDTNLSTRYWVSVVHAQALAGLDDTDGCHRALDHAEAVRDLHGLVHTGGWLRFDGSRLAEERGTCQVHLGQPDPAEITLTHALGTDLSARRRGGVLADLAMVGVLRRDPLRIVSYAEAALDIARHTRSGYLQTKLHTVAAHLAPFTRDRHIRHLHAQITDLTPATIQA